MTKVQMWAVLIGLILPYLVSVINQVGWPKWANFSVTIVACILGGLGTVYFAGSLNLAHPDVGVILEAIILVLTASQLVYKTYFKELVDSWLNAPTSFIQKT